MKIPSYWNLTILLEGGHSIKIKCKEFSFTLGENKVGYSGYKITGMKSSNKMAFSPSQMIGWTADHTFGFM